MPSAGPYPIVRGPQTLPKFFTALAGHARPDKPFKMKIWLDSSSLRSSYFDDTVPFARFIGLIDDDGPTELWTQCRDDQQRGPSLLAALKAKYAEPLRFLGIDVPGQSDLQKLSNYIKTNANVPSSLADAAAGTMVAVFDYALGRSAVPATAAAPATSKLVKAPERRSSQGRTPTDATKPAAGQHGGGRVPAQLAVNLQIVLPADAPDEKYDAILGAIARHLGSLLSPAG